MSSIINPEKIMRRWSFSAAAGVILFASIILSGSWACGQTLQLRFLFDDAGPGTTTTSDASGALGTGVTLFMETATAGTATNLHGAANSGVQGQGRGLDFSANTEANTAGNVAGLVAFTNNCTALGALGTVSNFTATIWFKMPKNPTNNANFGGRLFVLGTNGVNDTGNANSIGMLFNIGAGQLTNAIAARINGTQLALPIYNSLPTNVWQFVALVYDAGTSNALIYYGTEASPAKLLMVNNIGAQTVNFGTSGALQLGNRLNGRTRPFKGLLDDFRFYTGVGDATFVENIRKASTPVAVSDLYPDGSTLLQGTNVLTFTASSASGIDPSGIKVAVNGTDVSGSLVIGPTSTSRTVSYTGLPVDPTLVNNSHLNNVDISIRVTDLAGVVTSNTVSYDAFSANNFTWEAEDYDFSGGIFIDNPRYAFENTSGTTEDTYWQRVGTPPIDYFDGNNNGGHAFRPGDLMATEFSVSGGANGGISQGELMRKKVLDAYVLNSQVRDVNVGNFDTGNWIDFTRTYPAGLFNVYARAAFGGGSGVAQLSIVTNGAGTPTQLTNNLGSFSLPNTDGWQSYRWVPLRDGQGNLARVSLGGLATLQSYAGAGGGGNHNFYMLVTANTNVPVISGIYPNGSFQPSATFSFIASSPVGVTINTNSIKVTLSGLSVLGKSFTTNLTSTNGLVITGAATNRTVVYNGLQTNVSYTAVISVTDANGGPAGTTVSFDTLNLNFTWEAEDYNFGNGQIVPEPQTNAYAGQAGTAEVDYHDGSATQGTHAYRTLDTTGTEVNGDTLLRPAYNGTGLSDYDVGWYDNGDWNNYTRTFPAGPFNVCLRAANGGTGAGSLTLARVTSDPTTSPQTTTNLGTFTIPPTGGWQAYTWVPLRDAGGNLVQFPGGSLQTLRATSGGGLNANFYALVPADTNLPTINSIYPNGASLFQATNKLSFVAGSSAGITTNNIVVTLNGVDISTSLAFTGTTTSRSVSYTGLAANTNYTAVITVTDANGNVASTTVNFDTFKSSYYTWEMEDYDYDGGQFFDNPQIGSYSNLNATADVDFHDNNAGGNYLYRPTGTATEITADKTRTQFASAFDFNIGFFGTGEWGNYTRHYPAGTYNVWGRFACGDANQSQAILSVLTGGWGTTDQTTNVLGTFSVPTTGWSTFGWVPMRDPAGNLATVAFNGSTNTLKLLRNPTAPFADANVNFLMLVPTAAPIALTALISGNNINVSFQSQTGLSYQVEYKNNLTDVSWTPLGSLIVGDGTIKSLNDSTSGNNRFYRMRIQ